MAQLVQHNGKFYKGEPGAWQELSKTEFTKETMMQRGVMNQSGLDRGMAGAGYYLQNLGSGARELTYGDPQQEQQYRTDLRRDFGPHLDYGGFPVSAGQFGAGAASAVIPGGLKTQMAIGAAQGAAENPSSPLRGASLGGALTWAGDWAAKSIGRVARTLRGRRIALDPDYAATLARGQAEGLEFTPGQLTDDPARRMMEKQLMKNPRYAQADLDRFLSNQATLNSAAARNIGAPATGRVTPQMRGQAVEQVGKAFDDIATDSAPIELLGRDWLAEFEGLTDVGQALHERFVRRFPTMFEGGQVSGKQFIDARNWLAKQVRAKGNWQSGAAEELQPFLRIMDDSLEAANEASNPILVDNIRAARQKWKSLLVIEDSLRGAESAAKGNLTAATAYNVLKKYDKGGIFRGRARDPFSTIVDAMAAAGDAPPSIMPSTDMGQGGPLRAMKDMLYNKPAVESYMRGENIGKVMLGQLEEAGPITRGMQAGGVGAPRGIMALEQDENP